MYVFLKINMLVSSECNELENKYAVFIVLYK